MKLRNAKLTYDNCYLPTCTFTQKIFVGVCYVPIQLCSRHWDTKEGGGRPRVQCLGWNSCSATAGVLVDLVKAGIVL